MAIDANTPPKSLSLSIITPVKNRVNMIDDCLQSAIGQPLGDFTSMEIVVVDGGSTDGTLEKVQSYDQCRLFPESVRGIYEGMNAGIEAAKGDIICILNSDDQLTPGALEFASRAFRENPDAEVVAGRAIAEKLEQPDAPLVFMPAPVDEEFNSWPMLLWGSIAINARFFRREVFEKIGPFNTELTLAADREHLMRQRLAGIRSYSIDKFLYQYTAHSGSETMDAKKRNAKTMRDEHTAIAYWLQPQLEGDQEALSVLEEYMASELSRLSVIDLKEGHWRDAVNNLAHAARWEWRTARQTVYNATIRTLRRVRHHGLASLRQ